MSTECSTCGAAIEWAKTVHGKLIPIDVEPNLLGNLVVDSGGTAHSANADSASRLGRPLRISHFATCPDAAKHRRRRK